MSPVPPPSVSLSPTLAEILPILCCPTTRQPLRIATSAELVQLGLPCALVRADGLTAYPVADGIPVLLPESAIPLT